MRSLEPLWGTTSDQTDVSWGPFIGMFAANFYLLVNVPSWSHVFSLLSEFFTMAFKYNSRVPVRLLPDEPSTLRVDFVLRMAVAMFVSFQQLLP